MAATTRHTSTADCNLLDASFALSAAEMAYHISRHQMCAFLGGLFPIDAVGEHRMGLVSTGGGLAVGEAQGRLAQLVASLPAAGHPGDPRCASLAQDLAEGAAAPSPLGGQVALALSRADYLARWGQHYLPSLHGAHARQLCNSFKDPGPLRYGAGSPLFARCRDRLNAAFDGLPAPAPSRPPPPAPPGWSRSASASASAAAAAAPGAEDPGDALRSSGLLRRPAAPPSMRSYNLPDNPCFAARTPVRLAGGPRVPISSLRRGARVDTPRGPRAVAAVLATPVRGAAMARWRGVLVTPWHPVAPPRAGEEEEEKEEEEGPGGGPRGWAFPCQLGREEEGEGAVAVVAYTGSIYSVLLQRDDDPDAHAIMLGSAPRGGAFWGVTLGHGVLGGPDARAHRFFGSYDRVADSLRGLRAAKGGRFYSGGVERSKETGLVCGFKTGRPRLRSRAASSLAGERTLLREV